MIYRIEFTILVPTLTGTDCGVPLMWMVMENTMDLGETVIETAKVGEDIQMFFNVKIISIIFKEERPIKCYHKLAEEEGEPDLRYCRYTDDLCVYAFLKHEDGKIGWKESMLTLIFTP